MRRLGVLGDVHTLFDEVDVEQLDALGYDALLFVGDLATLQVGSDLSTAARIARLRTPTLVHPGNHDGVTPPQLFAEVVGSDALARWFAHGQSERVARLREVLAPHALTGYSRHAVVPGELEVVAGRPHSFGGGRLGCAAYLARAFGIDGLEASTARLAALLAEARSRDVVVLAHNGPLGLGPTPADPWGCDFRPDLGDFGDPDLAEALACARAEGAPVRVVVAGHMHHRIKGTRRDRAWAAVRHGVLHVNAARVPRIVSSGGRTERHHVRLLIGASEVRAQQVLLDEATGRERVVDEIAVAWEVPSS